MNQQKKKKKRRHPPRKLARWRSPRLPLRLLPEDEWLIKDTMARILAYEDEAKATETGQRALALCSRARWLGERNSRGTAHALYLEAAKLFEPDDLGAAAAWCWHCLAESFLNRPDGVRWENLEQARTLYLRALSSPQRQQDPHQYALSQNGLARCLRELAGQYDQPEYLDQAKELLVEACTTAARFGAVGWSWMVQHLHSLGNLCLRRGEVDEAIEVFEECHRHWEALSNHPQLPFVIKFEAKQNMLCALAMARMYRFRPDDRKHIARCLDQVIACGQPPHVDQARILRARFLLRRGQSHRAQAIAELNKVIVQRLPHDGAFLLAEAFEDAGRPDRACAVLTEQMHRALDRRKSARADHVAVHHAGEALRYAVRAAYLYVEAGDPIHAFLVLEHVSGNRYFDKVTLYSWRPRDPVTKYLDEQMRLHGDLAARLEDHAGWIASLPDDEAARQRFSSMLDEEWVEGELTLQQPETLALHGSVGITQARELQNQLYDILQGALTAPAPAAFLHEQSNRFAQMHSRYRTLCRARESGFEARDEPWMQRMTVAGLEAIAREHVDHVFVRIHVLDDLLVTSIWWDGAKLTGRALRMQIPGGYASLRQALDADPKSSSVLQDLLAKFDLSPALPPVRMKHAVLLPSLFAARLPLVALGPPGRTLLDHFDALSWLPTVVPLWMRQAPHRPRRGILSVIPGHTKHHATAWKTELDDEVVLRNDDATLLRLLKHIRDVDVVSFYTHGRHATPSHVAVATPAIQLHSGPRLSAQLLSDRFWAGMERVEIWACESGVDLPLDPRTPLVDEVFGFDALFHHWGVRSTIASLWKIPDYVTACIVDRYRKGLKAGLSAPNALAAAQRWWRDEAVPRLHQELRSRPEREALRIFTASLDLDELVPEFDAELGPVSLSQPTEERIAAFIRKMSSPVSWAGIRFLGVAERRPSEPWDPVYEGLPSDAERAELEALLTPSAPTSNASSESIVVDQPLTPDSALTMARRYRDSPLGASRHNLLRGLTWLHEAMMTGDLAPSRWIELAIEAAWMWLDLARSEAMNILDVTLRPAAPALLLRVERLLAGIEARGAASSIEAWVIRLWLEFLDRCRSIIQNSAMADEILASAQERAAILATEVAPEEWQSLRALGELMDLVALAPEVPASMAERLLAPLDKVADWRAIPVGVASRVLCAAAAVSNLAGLPCPFERPATESMTQRNVVRDWFSFITSEHQRRARSGEQDPHDIFSRDTRHARDDDLNWIDACYWDYPDSEQARFWRATGTSGPAHRAAIAAYIEGQIRGPYGAELATEMLASLQRLCDLRLLRLHLWARLFGRPGMEEMEAFWHLVRAREHFLEILDDASQVPLFEHGAPPVEGLIRCDPFFTGTEDILSASHSAHFTLLDATAWYLASEVHGWRMDDWQPVTATAAFEAERLLARLDQDISKMWPPLIEWLQKLDVDMLRGEVPQLLALEEPFVDLDFLEQLLRALPENWILIGVAVSPSGHIVATATMNIAGTFGQRVYRSPDPSGHVLAAVLATLQSPRPPAPGLGRAISTDRRSPWQQACSILEPLLDALIPAELRVPHLLILAPGRLRSLPWAGLRVRTQPLHSVAHTIRLLPAIGFIHNAVVTTPAQDRKHACLLAESPHEQSEGETRFGAAAISSLRLWFPPDAIIEPAEPVTGSDIVEVAAIEAIDHELGSLRMYGVATIASDLNTTTSGLSLSNRRVFSHHNTHRTKLPVCECVELWAETGCEGAASLALKDDRDRIPGLAWSFLSCGANGVVDLAWPVHDLVKALVCEHFGILRHAAHEPAPKALQRAIAWTASTLEVWRSALGGFSSVADALASLDDLRRHEAARRGLRTEAVQSFAVHADIPCVAMDVASLIDEVCQPVHLAAFRYWGT
jgi:CHAT domain-containing protein